MKISVCLLIISVLYSLQISAQGSEKHEGRTFKSSISFIPQNIKKRMKLYTWRERCPLPLNDLCYVTLSYWGFDKKTHLGSLIVNRSLAKEVIQIFKLLYLHQFPIERMELMDVFKGNDDVAMAANNTSSFNCRDLTGEPGIFSQHSYGRAIDINPEINPYVDGKRILPSKGSKFVDRTRPYPGKIIKDGLVYKLFIKYGWDWAGCWYDVQDYQHFEKRANGEKRNPYGD